MSSEDPPEGEGSAATPTLSRLTLQDDAAPGGLVPGESFTVAVSQPGTAIGSLWFVLGHRSAEGDLELTHRLYRAGANDDPGVAPYRHMAAMALEAYFPDLVSLRVPADYQHPTAVVCVEGHEADPEFCLDLVIRQSE
jgi:hypothetical protein